VRLDVGLTAERLAEPRYVVGDPVGDKELVVAPRVAAGLVVALGARQ
jgi:hypothetical protein